MLEITPHLAQVTNIDIHDTVINKPIRFKPVIQHLLHIPKIERDQNHISKATITSQDLCRRVTVVQVSPYTATLAIHNDLVCVII